MTVSCVEFVTYLVVVSVVTIGNVGANGVIADTGAFVYIGANVTICNLAIVTGTVVATYVVSTSGVGSARE